MRCGPNTATEHGVQHLAACYLHAYVQWCAFKINPVQNLIDGQHDVFNIVEAAFTQGKVAAAAVAALAAVLHQLPMAQVRPAMRGFWPPRTAALGAEVQTALAAHLVPLLDGLQGCMDGEDDVLAVAACFK